VAAILSALVIFSYFYEFDELCGFMAALLLRYTVHLIRTIFVFQIELTLIAFFIKMAVGRWERENM
jgi:hypothetical protein